MTSVGSPQRALSDWLQDWAAIPAQAGYEARWGVNYMLGGGLPVDWFDKDQRRHIMAYRMDNIPTMTVLAHRSPTATRCWTRPASSVGRSRKRRLTCGRAQPKPMSGHQPASGSRSGLTGSWPGGRPQCATSCGNQGP